MADQDRRNDGPSLELPSLRFGRRKRARDSGADPAPEPAPAEEDTRPLLADETVTSPLAPPAPRTGDAAEATPEPVPQPVPEPGPAAGAPRRAALRSRTQTRAQSRAQTRARSRRAPSMPVIGGMAAAVVTGAVIGLAIVGLTWGSQRTCEAARGTSSCGAAGFWLLVAILVAMVLLGAALLRAWRIPDPGSTSFLAVGLLAVVALLFLVDALFSRWMVLVIPLLTVGSFALAHWVTSTFVEPERD